MYQGDSNSCLMNTLNDDSAFRKENTFLSSSYRVEDVKIRSSNTLMHACAVGLRTP